MTKMPKAVQPELPLFGTKRLFEPVTRQNRDTRWYYVARTRKQTMLALDDKGRWVWIPHDTVRGIPHLFANKRDAQAVACTYPNAVVETYMWRVDPPPWKVT